MIFGNSMPTKVSQSGGNDKVMFITISLLASAVVENVAMPRLPTHPARAEYPGEDLISRPWAKDELVEMDAAFIAAMTRNGYAITTPSSRPGTKAPILGYRREDQ